MDKLDRVVVRKLFSSNIVRGNSTPATMDEFTSMWRNVFTSARTTAAKWRALLVWRRMASTYALAGMDRPTYRAAKELLEDVSE